MGTNDGGYVSFMFIKKHTQISKMLDSFRKYSQILVFDIAFWYFERKLWFQDETTGKSTFSL